MSIYETFRIAVSYYAKMRNRILEMKLLIIIIHRLRFVMRTSRMLLHNRKCFLKKSHGLILPIVRFIFTLFRYLSLMTLFRVFFYRKWNQRHVDIYLLIWFLFYISSYFYLDYLFKNSGYIPDLIYTLLVVFCILRIIDVVQTWFHVLLIPPHAGISQRVLILTVWNYMEIAVLYGILGYLFQAYGYYNISSGNIQVADSIRFSLGIVTPLGILDNPKTWTGGIMFYTEYLLGLFFLIIVITKAVSYVGRKRTLD